MAASRKPTKSVEIQVESLQVGEMSFCILGLSPLIFNSISLKAKKDLLFPRGRLTEAQKAQNLKHDPLQEYRDSVYRRIAGVKGPTRLLFPSPALKGAMANAALDLPAVTKTKIERLTWTVGQSINIWGVPQLLMSPVRNADPGRTPDIRTRAILAQWAGIVTVRFIEPMLSAQIVSRLLSAGGLICGIGDWRQEKGSGSNGQFELVLENHPQFQEVVASGGMLAQDEALENPVCFDADSEALFTWFGEEYQRRAQDRRGTGRSRGKKSETDDLSPVELPPGFPFAAAAEAVATEQPKRRARRSNNGRSA